MPDEKTPSVPPVEGESTEETKPKATKVNDAKEEARRRSKEDLERKRRLNHGSHGKR